MKPRLPRPAFTSSASRGFAVLLLVVLAIAMLEVPRPSATAAPAPAPAPVAGGGYSLPLLFGAASLDAEKSRGEELVRQLRVTEVLGPLAPVALSPFFALTCLSGASLLADTGILPEGVASNPLLGRESALNNGFVFAGLLVLTILTAAPKLTKLTKPLAQAVDQIEAHAGIIAVVAVQLLSQVGRSEPAAPETTMLIQAGIFTATLGTIQTALLAVFSAINIFVVNTVKFFFETLTWLSPFPAVDAVFEAANKSFAAFLLGVYLFSPSVATVLNLLIFAVCLLIFLWAYRRVVYMRSVIGDPLLGWIAGRVFGRPPVSLTSTRLHGALARQFPRPAMVVKAFVGRSYQGVPRKAVGFLVQNEGRLFFGKPRLLRSPLVVPLPDAGHELELDPGLLSNSIIFRNDAGERVLNVIFTRRYNPILAPIRDALGVTGAADSGTAPVAERGLETMRTIKAAVKGGSRDALRADLA